MAARFKVIQYPEKPPNIHPFCLGFVTQCPVPG